jgi:membrane protein implicated in regulation of membrane protease activity
VAELPLGNSVPGAHAKSASRASRGTRGGGGVREWVDRLVADCPSAAGDHRVGCVYMPAWLVWLVAAAVLGTAELMTLAFAAGLMASAAVVAAVVAGLGGGLEVQSLAFAATSFASLAVVLPLARRRGTAVSTYRSGVAGLTDRPAVVLTQVDGISGTVRIGGEVWSARAYDDTLVIAEGTRVTVLDIDGATALVYPREY